MEKLLLSELPHHFGMMPLVEPFSNFSQSTKNIYFELIDADVFFTIERNSGCAKFSNEHLHTITVINYEEIIGCLARKFREGRKVCDYLLYTASCDNFFICELTDTKNAYVTPYTNNKGIQAGKRATARAQLTQTLADLLAVPGIAAHLGEIKNRRCCLFNRQVMAPESLTAIKAFSRLDSLSVVGYKISNPEIEAMGFGYYEYSGNQICPIL